MKKLFIKSLMTVGVVGLVGLTSAAMAAEFNWNGSIRAGYKSVDSGVADSAADKKFGGNQGSRIGINASTDLGNGQSAGAELSYNVGSDTLSTRRQNVFVSGGWGKLTFGQHGGIYRSAANWDQAFFLGGNVRFGAAGGGDTGLVYASNLSGPFSFDIEIASSDAVTAVDAVDGIFAVTRTTPTATIQIGILTGGSSPTATVTTTVRDEVAGVKAVDGKAIGRWAATAHYDFGGATVNLGHNATQLDAAGYNDTAISVNGSVGSFGYYVAYEINKANDAQKASATGGDANTVGVFLSYGISGNDTVYLEYESAKVDAINNDPKATLVGYSHSLGEGVTFIGEYVTTETINTGVKGKTLALALKYDF